MTWTSSICSLVYKNMHLKSNLIILWQLQGEIHEKFVLMLQNRFGGHLEKWRAVKCLKVVSMYSLHIKTYISSQTLPF